MKRTLSIIAALLAIMSIMTFAVGAAVGEVESGYTPASGSVGISSLSEITDPAGVYHLTGDITVDATYAEAFSGVLDGCGHTVTVSAPMFAELNGTVKNMILNGSIKATDTSAAAVALKSTSGMTAMNITSNVDITVSGTASDLYAAAIVCKNSCITVSSLFESIVNNGDMTVNAPESSKPRAAGIAAIASRAVFTDCLNNGTVNALGSQVVVGGICARACDAGSAVEADFYHCINNGDVSGVGYNAYAAGICAYNGRKANEGVHDYINCVNTGDISADYRSAGITAYVYGSKTQSGNIEYCINTGTITFGGNVDENGVKTHTCGSPFVAYTNSANTVIKNNIDTGSLVSVEENAIYSFIACSSVNYTENLFSDNYVTNVATKFNYFAYSATEANVIAIDQAGTALTDTTIDYLKSEEFTAKLSGFIKTDSLPVTQSGDSWNGGEYVMAVGEHVCGDLSYVEAVASTCGTAGNTEYYKCACGKWYSDAEARTEITDKASVVLPLDPDAHVKTYGDVSTITFTGAYNNAETFTLPVTCAHCDWTDSITIVPKMGENYTGTSKVSATCQQTEGIRYRQLDFGTGKTYDFVAYNPDGATDPTRHITLDSYKDNGDCSHTIVYSCCENATKITYHTYSSGLCRYCGASQEERDPMHKWEVSYEWRLDSDGIPYGCIARRICSVCNRTNSTSSKDISFVGDEDINCQQGATRTYTAKFSSDWAETQIKSVSIDKNPNVHAANSYVWYINNDGTHSRKYVCCGALTNTSKHVYDETTNKCKNCGYTDGATLYTVTFVVDGKVWLTTNACVGSTIRTPIPPEKEGYLYMNWYTQENGQGTRKPSVYNVEGDSTYYAYYTDETVVYWYIVYPDGSNEHVPPNSLIKVGTTIEPNVSIIRVGYYVDGWYTTNKLVKAFDFTAPIVNYTSIYAKLVECTSHIWGEVAYEWTEDYSGCTAVRRCTRCNYAETDVATSVQVSVTEKATCAKAGSATGTVTFAAEWATDMSGEIIIAIDPDNHANPSVTYKWENDDAGIPYKCTATLNCSECGYKESVSVKPTSTSYNPRPTCQAEGVAYKTARFSAEYPWAEEQKSEEYVVAKDPNRHISYVFSIKDDTYHTRKYTCCGVEEDYEHDMKDDVCLICGYKKGEKQYTVTYIVDGMEYCRIKVSYGSSINRPIPPSKEGYAFVGWYTEENGKGKLFTSPYNTEGDTTYYAYFTNKVSYRFCIINLEGKQQTIIPYTEVLYGTTVSAPTYSEYADKIPEGHYIEGWYTSSNYATEFDFSKPLIQYKTSIYGKLAELKGWCKIDGEWYYYNEDGTKATGFSRVPYNTELGHAPNADDLAYFNANSETSKYTDATTAVYCFGEDGKLLRKTGIVDDKGSVRYAVDGVIAWHVGLVEADGEYYYFGGDANGGGNVMLTGNVYATRNTTKLDMVKSGVYTFAEDGKMCKYEGLTEIDGVLYYYEDYCRSKGTGVVKTAEGYIYVRTTNLEVVTDKQYWVSKTAESGVIKGIYVIDENGFIKDPILVNSEATTGIFDGYYYVDGEVQYAAGAIEIDGDIYYVRANGQIVAGGEYWVTQSSELLPAGKYTFDNDGKLVK